MTLVGAQVARMDFDLSFRDGAAFPDQWEDGTFYAAGTFKVTYLGDLVMPTGVLVACDALVVVYVPAFVRTVSPGRYPVHVSTADIQTGACAGITWNAFARVKFSDRPVVRWELALRVGDAPAKPRDVPEEFGYPVDSGTGGFMDQAAVLYLDALSSDESQAVTERFIAELNATDSPIDFGLSFVIDPTTGANVVSFMSGAGDGWYASYWGLDVSDQPVCIVTDFGIIRL